MVIADRVGLAIRGDTAAVARTRRGRVIGGATAERTADEPWADFLGRVLAPVARRSLIRARLAVIVADERCRVGPLHGEAATESAREVALRFVSNPGEYRVVGVGGAVGGDVWRDGDEWFGVSLDAALAEALGVAAESARLDLRVVRPGPGDESSLEQLAVAAAGPEPRTPGRLDLQGPARRTRARTRVRSALAATAGLVLVASVATPVTRAVLDVRALEGELRSISEERGPARPGDLERRARSRIERELSTGRGRATELLTAIARVLPESSAVVSLRLERTSGNLTVVAPRVADAVAQLVKLPAISGARLEGAVVAEDHGGVTLQRATLSWAGGVR